MVERQPNQNPSESTEFATVLTGQWWVNFFRPFGGGGAITIRNTIYVRQHFASDRLLRHEMKHVEQWRRYGTVGFLVRYAVGLVASLVYWDKAANPLELEAMEAE